MRMGFARSAAGVMALLFGVANVAGATGVGSQPLAVQSASLTQNGEQLIWQLQMSEPFSPGALARERRALCLLVERADNGAVTGQLCLVGPRKGQRAPRVRYASGDQRRQRPGPRDRRDHHARQQPRSDCELPAVRDWGRV